MSRTLGKISSNGQELTGFVPVRIRCELGVSTGHASLPKNMSAPLKPGKYTLRLRNDQELAICLNSVTATKVYFYSLEEVALT